MRTKGSAMRVCLRVCMVVAASAVATCGSHEHGSPGDVDEIINSCKPMPDGEPFASDESWTKFVEAEAAGRVMMEDCRAPVLLSPAPGSALDPDVPPTISFSATQPACAQASRRVPAAAAACRTVAARGRLQRLWAAVSPIGVAHAHCPEVNGPNYVLRISDSDGKSLYSALLSVTSFKPKDDLWRKALGGRRGQSVRVTIQRGEFVRGNIMQGPFVQKQPFSLTVRP